MLTIYPHRLSRLQELIQDPDRSRVSGRIDRGLAIADRGNYERARWFFERAAEIATTEREAAIVATAIEFANVMLASPDADPLATAVTTFSAVNQYFAGE